MRASLYFIYCRTSVSILRWPFAVHRIMASRWIALPQKNKIDPWKTEEKKGCGGGNIAEVYHSKQQITSKFWGEHCRYCLHKVYHSKQQITSKLSPIILWSARPSMVWVYEYDSMSNTDHTTHLLWSTPITEREKDHFCKVGGECLYMFLQLALDTKTEMSLRGHKHFKQLKNLHKRNFI